jgi:hypothetical protein
VQCAEMLLDAISAFRPKIDLFYVPVDYVHRVRVMCECVARPNLVSFVQCNVGYAFVNFTDVSVISSFYNRFHGYRWRMRTRRCDCFFCD